MRLSIVLTSLLQDVSVASFSFLVESSPRCYTPNLKGEECNVESADLFFGHRESLSALS